MPDNVLGLDLSRYREGVPLKTAKQQGVRFILAKATEGTAYTDPEYFRYQTDSAAKGLPFGGFLYWRFIFEAVAQAKYYCSKLLEHGAVQFPPIVDIERIYNVKEGTTDQVLVSVQANRNHLQIVLNVIEEKLGIKPMIYTNYESWRVLMGNWDIWDEYELWVANWRTVGAPLLPIPAKTWKVHQWTNAYKVEGYSRGLDADWFNGNEGAFELQLIEWDLLWNPAAPPLPMPPESSDLLLRLEAIEARLKGLDEVLVGQDDIIAAILAKVQANKDLIYVTHSTLMEVGALLREG